MNTFFDMNIGVPNVNFAKTPLRKFFHRKITTAIDSSTPLYYRMVLSVFNLDFKKT
jgi:hypothetical protein